MAQCRAYFPMAMLLLLVSVTVATPPGIAKNPSHATCKIKKYKQCYNLPHVCPKFCPDQCYVECASCKPICGVAPPNPPYSDDSPSPPEDDGSPKPPSPSKDDKGNDKDDKGTGKDDKGSGKDDKGSGKDDKGNGKDDKGNGKDDKDNGKDDKGNDKDDGQGHSPYPPTNPPTPNYPPETHSPPPTPTSTPPAPETSIPHSPPTQPPPVTPPSYRPPQSPSSTPLPSPPTPTPPTSTPSFPSPQPSSPPTLTPPTPPPSSPSPQQPSSAPSPSPTTTTSPSTNPSPPTPAPYPPSTPPTPSTPSETPSPPTKSPPPSNPSADSGQRRARCKNRNYPQCYNIEYVCPSSCPGGCEVDCVSCKPVCKCDRPGAVCQDPRFIGGDGITFYFHGKKDRDFCLVSDYNLHINGHFIGRSNQNMKRDFTWVQSIGVLFDKYQLFIGALKTATWDDAVDRLAIYFNGEPVTLPASEGVSWKSSSVPRVSVIRTADANSVNVEVQGMFRITAKAVPISEQDSIVHNYGITKDDCFAHLDLGFKFFSLSNDVSGVLGQTYKSEYVSRVKIGAAMPVMGGDKEFRSSSMFSTDCAVARFASNKDSNMKITEDAITGLELPALSCASGIGGRGVVCKR